ncbi:MAG: DNA adenine methylase [Magnetococcus sp. THC-1_WYH]
MAETPNLITQARSKYPPHVIDEKQLSLSEEAQPRYNRRIVNVASVPQLSPFRYPGGKTWLVPEIRQWLSSKKTRPSELIEPFAGGGIVSLTVANERLADHVTMIELDPDVAAVWHTIFSDDAAWLADRILGFELTIDTVQATLALTAESVRDHAFQTILRNRINHGGILAPGSGVLKYGENGKGIASRWYADTLAKRIRKLFTLRDRITFIEGDGLIYLSQTLCREDVTYFIDPPYTAPGKCAGRRLYRYSEIDHGNLFSLCQGAAGDFMMTYDDTEFVRNMAKQRGFHIDRVPMKNTHHAELFELLIFTGFSRSGYPAMSGHQAA